MKKNKTISIVLLLVFILQLLPVKQAIQYFFVDNLTNEEIVDTVKTASKPAPQLDEDHFLHVSVNWGSDNALDTIKTPPGCFYFIISSPVSDVETPPPDTMIAC